jgi:RNA polymerase sigma factor (sigma-70 family)
MGVRPVETSTIAQGTAASDFQRQFSLEQPDFFCLWKCGVAYLCNRWAVQLADAEDAVSDVLPNLIQKWPALAAEARRPYFYGAINQSSLAQLNKAKRRNAICCSLEEKIEAGGFQPSDNGRCADLAVTAAKIEQYFDQIDATLNRGEKQVVNLYYYEGMTTPQIAAALNLKLGTVTSRLTRALGKMRATIAISEPGPVEGLGLPPAKSH